MYNNLVYLFPSSKKSLLLSFMQISLNSVCLTSHDSCFSYFNALSLTLWQLCFIGLLKIGILMTKSRCCLQKWNKGLYSICIRGLKNWESNFRSKIRLCFCYFSKDCQNLMFISIAIMRPWLTLLVSPHNFPGEKSSFLITSA